MIFHSEAVVRRRSLKKVLLKTSQNSQENTLSLENLIKFLIT